MKTALLAAALLLAPATFAQTASPTPEPAATPAPAAAAPKGSIRNSSAAQMHAELATQVPAPKLEDVKSPEALVAATYSVISGPAGKRDWDRFRSLFLPSGRLTATAFKPDGTQVVASLSVEDYVQHAGDFFAKSGFYEQGMRNQLNQFGNVAQIFTSYESRLAPGEKPFQRGINSFQMVNDGQRWWIVSIAWDDERKDNPIPPDMLPK